MKTADDGGFMFSSESLTLRDWFAGQAMVAFGGIVDRTNIKNNKEFAESCYAMADEMIEARGTAREEAVSEDARVLLNTYQLHRVQGASVQLSLGLATEAVVGYFDNRRKTRDDKRGA